MLRIASLTMILLLSTGLLLPFAGSSAHGLRQNFIAKRHYQRRHSRAWWRRHRARMARLRLKRRREAEIIARRRSMLTPVKPLSMARNVPQPAPVAVSKSIPVTTPVSVPVRVPLTIPTARRILPTIGPVAVPSLVRLSTKVRIPITVPPPTPVLQRITLPATPALRSVTAPAADPVTVSVTPSVMAPVAAASARIPRTALAHAAAVPAPTSVSALSATQALPAGWNKLAATKNGEMKFRTETATGVPNGAASLDVVAQSRPNPLYMSAREERRLLAGIAIGDLRSMVIDKMISDGGWVINDYFRDVAGQRIFIVTAQTPGDGRSPDKCWNFYFTEVNGRIYRLTTNTPQQFSDRMAAEAESFIASFHAISKPASK